MDLKAVKTSEISTDQEVRAFLDGNPSVSAVVLSSGDVFFVKNKGQEFVYNALFKLIKRIYGRCNKQVVTPIEFQQWKQTNEKKKEQQKSDKTADKLNTSLEWIFQQAIDQRASDVYLIIGPENARVEIKIYGSKQDLCNFNSVQGYNLANMIWSSAQNNQYNRSEPCDCSFSFPHNQKVYRIRANSVCTANGGNTIACRIRDPREIHNVEELGYSEDQLELLRRINSIPGGLILFTGATNSGKSTSVTSYMRSVPSTAHMIEVADPVEVELENCTHVEIDRYHQDHEAIFMQILASFVRQNPDVLVLGEIRDRRTAEAAVNMAIQGKRVYSTLHSATAVGVFARLSGLGVPDHILSLPEFIAGIVSQSLVPVPCINCGIGYTEVPDSYLKRQVLGIEGIEIDNLRFCYTDGCAQCKGGISGQTLVAEVHPYGLDDGGVHQIIKRKEYFHLEKYMRIEHKVMSKWDHAIHKMNHGEIEPVETLRIIGMMTKGVESNQDKVFELGSKVKGKTSRKAFSVPFEKDQMELTRDRLS